jgi:hypothetical protein
MRSQVRILPGAPTRSQLPRAATFHRKMAEHPVVIILKTVKGASLLILDAHQTCPMPGGAPLLEFHR